MDNPILTGVDLLKIRSLDQPGFKAQTISLLFYKNTSLEKALDQLNIAVDRAAASGCNILILSDRGVDENHVPIPSLLAVSSVEQHLVQTKKRTAASPETYTRSRPCLASARGPSIPIWRTNALEN